MVFGGLDDGDPVALFYKAMEMFKGNHVGMAATDKHKMFAHSFLLYRTGC
jgi:hypothetical protein